MRSIPIRAILIACVIALGHGRAPAAEGVEPARRDRLVVRGLSSLDPDSFARSLAADDDLLLFTSPLTTRKALIAAVVDKATLALQREGFATPQVTAAVEQGDGSGQVTVDVVEGPRQMAAGIEVTGLPDDLAGDLRRWLKSERPPSDAVPHWYDADDGWSGTRWIDQRGQPARMEPPLWTPGEPAALDPHRLRAIRAAIARFLREHGFFVAAKLLDTPKPGRAPGGGSPTGGPSLSVAVRSGVEGAVLAIDAVDLPPPSILRSIDLFAGARITAAHLERILGIEPGSPVTERDRLAWRESLRLSGRFVRHEVKFKEVPADGDGASPGIVATFDLQAYPHVPPLTEPLSRAEQAALRFRRWLLETLANDDDLVLTWASATAEQPVGSLVVSTRQGMVLTALPGSEDACGVAIGGDGLGWFLPREAGWFSMPLPVRKQLNANVALFLTETVEVGRHTYTRQFAVDSSLEPRPRGAPALSVTARIEPVACLAFLHDGNPTLSWEGDELIVARPDVTARIDFRTGRLVSVDLPGRGTVTIEAAPGRFTAAVTALLSAAGDDLTRDDALVSSGVEFFTGPAAGTAAEHLVEATGHFRGIMAWRGRIESVAEKLRDLARSGGFATADRVLADALARAADTTPLITVPAAESHAATADHTLAMASLAAAQAWRWTQHVCGRDAWPAALARVAMLAARKDAGVLWEFAAYVSAAQHGPLAYLAAATAAPTPALAASLARQGQGRLSVERFHDDCLPVLELLATCGLDRCTVSLVRTLDDDEAQRLGEACFGSPDLLLPLVDDLRGCDSDEAAVAALPAALDHWWTRSLCRVVTAALAARTETQTADKPPAEPSPRR